MSTTFCLALTGIAHSANTCTDTCDVTNQTTGVPFGSDLQGAINAATSGDTLDIRGLCQGNFTITNKDLILFGKSTDHCPQATLQNIAVLGTTLTINAAATNTITLMDLVITGGTNSGIRNINSTLNLRGTTEVSGNAANADKRGGGIRDLSSTGVINMYNKSQVSNNTAVSGGGIFSLAGTVRMFNAATVMNNTVTAIATSPSFGGGITSGGVVEMFNNTTVKNNNAVSGTTFDGFGGGISCSGTLTLNNNAAIINNSAFAGGGINSVTLLAARPASVTLNDNATITENTATEFAGGIASSIFISGTASVTLNKNARINNNSAGNQGGGVFNDTSSTLTMTGHSLIDENTAVTAGGGIFNNGTLVGATDGVNVINNTPDNIAP